MIKIDKEKIIPLLGLYVSSILNAILIHFWLADLAVTALDISRRAAYGALISLVLLMTVFRTFMIFKNRDAVTQWIDAHIYRKDEKQDK
ncbi:MAG: hypothetical protein H7Z73_08840 [Candidatus Saccharibacteria bacterium]|nr:hypothetical protein [Moraxellaceae bacterium]